jgi:small multidrug resistance pump
MTGWLLLAAAIITEVLATTALTYSDGLTRHTLTLVTAVLYVLSYISLARALKAGMEISVAYAVWSGVGTAALALIGAMLFDEPMSLQKIAAIVLIVGGVTLLNLSHTSPRSEPVQAVQASADSADAAVSIPEVRTRS